MSQIAKIIDNVVVDLINAEPDFIDQLQIAMPGEWIVAPSAAVGFNYDRENNIFYPPQPYPSWQLNINTWLWEAPVIQPGPEYEWNEESQSWTQ